jgi:hypothetical protein
MNSIQTEKVRLNASKLQNVNVEEILTEILSLNVKFDDETICYEFISIILDKTKLGAEDAVALIINKLPQAAKPPFNNSMQKSYKETIKRVLIDELMKSSEAKSASLAETLRKLRESNFFEIKEVIEMLEKLTMQIGEQPNALVSLLRCVEAFEDILTVPKKLSKNNQLIMMRIGDSLTVLLDGALSIENQRMIRETLKVLKIDQKPISDKQDSDIFKKIIQTVNDGLLLDDNFEFSFRNPNDKAELIMANAEEHVIGDEEGLKRLAFAVKNLLDIKSGDHDAKLFQNFLEGMCKEKFFTDLASSEENLRRTTIFISELAIVGILSKEFLMKCMKLCMMAEQENLEIPASKASAQILAKNVGKIKFFEKSAKVKHNV